MNIWCEYIFFCNLEPCKIQIKKRITSDEKVNTLAFEWDDLIKKNERKKNQFQWNFFLFLYKGSICNQKNFPMIHSLDSKKIY